MDLWLRDVIFWGTIRFISLFSEVAAPCAASADHLLVNYFLIGSVEATHAQGEGAEPNNLWNPCINNFKVKSCNSIYNREFLTMFNTVESKPLC